MSNEKLGENMAREWNEDARAAELWDAFRLLKFNSFAGLKEFEALAASGSSLAQMYLGSYRISGKYGIPKDREKGEFWLRCSASNGSIEAAYGLARHLLVSGQINEAREYYEKIADLGYAPALFALGSLYCTGRFLDRDIYRALCYYERAESKGHLRAAFCRYRLLMGTNLGMMVWFRSLIKLIALTPACLKMLIAYPRSDLLR